MKISINFKRVIQTTVACFVAALLPPIISKSEMFYTLAVPLFYSIAIPLTNLDNVITKRKSQAFVLSILLTIILFFSSVSFGLLLGQSFLGTYSIHVVCLISGLLTLLINSIFIRIDNILLGLLITGFFALSIPFLTLFLKGYKIFNIDLFGDPVTFFIVWPTIMGLAISISIWTKTTITKAIIE
ncbi:MAG: hypothetical protein IPN36_12720 [Bacteroidetes bacterium]|nr:hypothetical protein [Bacteroidota bacterium]